jgi:lysine 2,3-aminomutase
MSELYKYDPSNEAKNFRIPGLQHKYRETVLLFVAEDCHSICDWCFRKRLFVGEAMDNDVVVDPQQALAYLKNQTEVRSVLMSGGDALLAKPGFLEELLNGMGEIEHLHDIRIGSRALVHDPLKYGEAIPHFDRKKVYIVSHIVRPEEIRDELIQVRKSFPNYTFYIQTPLLKDVNDDPHLLADIWYAASEAGMQPYYVFQCRPTQGNQSFSLSLREGHEVFSGAQALCTGVVKPCRYVMSTGSGKWEIIGIDYNEVILRCHQGVNPLMVGMIRRADPNEVWWDLPEGDPILHESGCHRPFASAE